MEAPKKSTEFPVKSVYNRNIIKGGAFCLNGFYRKAIDRIDRAGFRLREVNIHLIIIYFISALVIDNAIFSFYKLRWQNVHERLKRFSFQSSTNFIINVKFRLSAVFCCCLSATAIYFYVRYTTVDIIRESHVIKVTQNFSTLRLKY